MPFIVYVDYKSKAVKCSGKRLAWKSSRWNGKILEPLNPIRTRMREMRNIISASLRASCVVLRREREIVVMIGSKAEFK